jgi:predicted NodU family carbamoyl transferase
MQSQTQSIQQINLAYDSHQDRLLLKAAVSNDQEIRVWITYRVARQIFTVLNREAHLPVTAAVLGSAALLDNTQSPAEATRQFEQEAEAVQDLEALDFETAYQQRAASVSDQELLAVETRFVSINDQLNNMQLACAGGVNVNMGLNKELVLAISRMLMIASKDAGWVLASAEKEPEAVSSIVMQVPAEKQVLH